MRRMLSWLGMTSVTALVFATAAALAPRPVPANALAPSKTVTITVAGISRTGATVAVVSEVTPLHGNSEPGTGPTYHLKPGIYFIAADVPTVASSKTPASQTIVVRRIDVVSGGTIKLDSRGGKLVSVWLNGKDLGEPPEAGACIANGLGIVYSDPNAGPLYVEPTKVAGVSFEWAITTRGPKGSSYDLAGQTKTGLPSEPAFRLRTSGLVKTVIEAKIGTVPDTVGRLFTSSTVYACGLNGIQETHPLPMRMTVYRSPATWMTQVGTSHGLRMCSLSWLTGKETPGHSYTFSLGDAATGPSEAVPVIQGTNLAFDPHHQFVGPVAQGYNYCYQATVTLSSGGHTITTQRFGQALRNFSATVHAGRWYVLTTDARQTAPRPDLARLLSPRTTLRWRFKIARGAAGAVAVAVTSLVPQGLDMYNEAAPGSTTPVRAFFTQGSYSYAPPAPVPVRSFVVQASFNDGKTWRSVAVVKHQGYWTFAVHNPSSGYVTLRTTTVNTLGNSSVQTTYRAYRIR